MVSLKNTPITRRMAIRPVLRYVAIGVLASIGGMTFRKKDPACEEKNNKLPQVCQTCGILQHCSLPQANTAKRINKVENHG